MASAPTLAGNVYAVTARPTRRMRDMIGRTREALAGKDGIGVQRAGVILRAREGR